MISIWSAKNFTPLSWFSAGQQGAWYDPSDLTTLYQDSAGTTSVTAVEQPVGKMLDKSGRGNHAIQATAGNRPTLSARVNLLTYSEQFDNVAWVPGVGVSVTVNSTTAPNGTSTADLIASPQDTGCYQNLLSIGSGITVTNSVYIKAGTATQLLFRDDLGSGRHIVINPLTGQITGSSGTILSSGSISIGNGWYRYYMTYVTDSANVRSWVRNNTAGTLTYYTWGADLRLTNAGALLPVYQRVNAATDYDTVGFPLYLKCNGASSAMATNNIDFTATNQMTVVSGLRKLNDAGQGILSELSATSATNNGSFTLSAPAGASANYSWLSKGTVADTITSGTFTAPITNVISGLSSIGAPSNAMRINSAVQSVNNNSEGTGNYGNYPLYLFARAGTSSFFNGQFYGAVIVGQTETTQQIQQAERYMATKTGISF